MSDWNHHTPYRFYFQKYPDSKVNSYGVQDIEETFKCRYVSLQNGVQPAPKTVYTEDYPEHNGLRVYADESVKVKSSELTLTLRWRSEECGSVQSQLDYFLLVMTGRKIEYHDTFRPNKYWQLILDSAPEIVAEKLYGDKQYIFVKFKFTNFGGRPYTESQLNQPSVNNLENIDI